MANYDGPSYFKKDHPKVKKMKKSEETKYSLPKTIRTPKNMQEEARHYMKTPSKHITSDPPPERYPFKPTQTPASLQKLDGWDKQNIDVELYTEVYGRLQKDTDTYLLFADHLSDEMKKKVEEKKEVPRQTPIVKEENITLMREGMAESLLKTSSGLHRSLSNIIADEQKTIHKNRDGLEKLFNQSNKGKKS